MGLYLDLKFYFITYYDLDTYKITRSTIFDNFYLFDFCSTLLKIIKFNTMIFVQKSFKLL